MTHYPTVMCPVCKWRVGSGLPGQLTPAHHAALLLVHQGACSLIEDPQWVKVAAAANEIMDAYREAHRAGERVGPGHRSWARPDPSSAAG